MVYAPKYNRVTASVPELYCWYCTTDQDVSHTAAFSGIARSITKNNTGVSNILYQTRNNELIYSNATNYNKCKLVLYQNTLFPPQADGCSLKARLTNHKHVNDRTQRR